MSLDDPKAQEKLTPEARRQMLRAFGDRMLIKLSNIDDPEDLPGVECAVRAAAAIERIYSRCDRAETHAPDPRKLEAERATNMQDAIKARVHLAGTLQWGEQRRRDLGPWWDAAETKTDTQTQALAAVPGLPQPSTQAIAQKSAMTPAPVQAPAATRITPRAGLETKAATPVTPAQLLKPASRRLSDSATALLRLQTLMGDFDERDWPTPRSAATGHGPPSG